MEATPQLQRRLNILVADYGSAAGRGGMSRIMRFVHDFVVEAGHRVIFFTDGDLAHLSKRRARTLFFLYTHRQILAATRSGRPYDIVTVQQSIGWPLALLRWLWGLKYKLVLMNSGLEELRWQNAQAAEKQGRKRVSLSRRAHAYLVHLWPSRVGLIMADFVFNLREIDHLYLAHNMRLPEERTLRVFPGAATRLGIEAGSRDFGRARTLLFAAPWAVRNGAGRMRRAFENLCERYPGLQLLLLDAGIPESRVLLSFDSTWRENVQVVAHAGEAEILEAHREADILVLAGEVHETPPALIEGMMSGLPVVATAVCGVRDVIQDGVNGLLVEPRDAEALEAAIERLLTDGALRARLGQAAHAQALDEFTWRAVAQPVIRAYERIAVA